MEYPVATTILTNVKGLKYDGIVKRYILDKDWVDGQINVNLAVLYKGKTNEAGLKNAQELLDRVSRHFYNYVYDKLTWVEDFSKKEYLILTTQNTVKRSRDIMLSHLESVVLTRRDLLIMESAIDLDGNSLIEDFDKNIEMYQFALDTRRIFNQDRNLRYRERLTNRVISDIGVGY